MNNDFLEKLDIESRKLRAKQRMPVSEEYTKGYIAGAKWAHRYHGSKNKFNFFVMTALSTVSGFTLVWKFTDVSIVMLVCVIIIAAWAFQIIRRSKLFNK